MAKKQRSRGRSNNGQPHAHHPGGPRGGYHGGGNRGPSKPHARKRSRRGGGGGGHQGGNGQVSPDEFEAIDPDAPTQETTGVLEMHPSGYGFLRTPNNNYARERDDVFVPVQLIDRFKLREGVMITGPAQPTRRQQGPRLKDITSIDGFTPEEYAKVKPFDSLTPINPEEWLRLETGATPISTRTVDLLAPLGKGQRGLIVAPPRSGKTVLLQQISHAISENYPDVKLFVMLIDERPEEVTEMKRMVNGEVVASSLDKDTESHARIATLIIERCRRLVEEGRDVFLLLDSITRLARAFNKLSNSNRTMSGGIDIKALDIPKKLFATARAFEEGGSLTIVASALIETGSRMDEVIFQEFKGTGNMELVLSRKLADRRVWPAIDIEKSGTRREEKLYPPEWLNAVTMLRRTLGSMNHIDAMEQLQKTLGRFDSNDAFIDHIGSVRQKA